MQPIQETKIIETIASTLLNDLDADFVYIKVVRRNINISIRKSREYETT
jgi:hypothetical protein